MGNPDLCDSSINPNTALRAQAGGSLLVAQRVRKSTLNYSTPANFLVNSNLGRSTPCHRLPHWIGIRKDGYHGKVRNSDDVLSEEMVMD